MRVVFDTVILVRGLISPYSWWGRLLFDYPGAYDLVVSPAVLSEYLDVIRRPELTRKYRGVATRNSHAILDRLAIAEVVHPLEVPSVGRDPHDDVFFATAKAGNAAYIVSEDNDQLAVGDYEGIKVVTAEAFLRILDQRESGVPS
jgi:putative PIN family toxin of toxin-antitoxin system